MFDPILVIQSTLTNNGLIYTEGTYQERSTRFSPLSIFTIMYPRRMDGELTIKHVYV